jgi:hypothetical protein
MKYLSVITGDDIYWHKAERVMEVLDSNGAKDGLVPIYVHPDTGVLLHQVFCSYVSQNLACEMTMQTHHSTNHHDFRDEWFYAETSQYPGAHIWGQDCVCMVISHARFWLT